MEYIDIDSWDRREYFLGYLGRDFPYINIGAHLDITRLVDFCRDNQLSSYITMVYAAHHTAESIENFRYRIKDGKPIINQHMTPSFTYIPEGSELFIEVTVDFDEDLTAFHRAAKEQIARQGTDTGLAALKGRYDLIMYSAIPWIQYTHVVRSIAVLGVDSNPKISWGRYFHEGGRTLVPFSVQVHHGLMDGLHVGRYYERIQQFIDEL
jgi:chloramphenicol O-acetyltransferase type A